MIETPTAYTPLRRFSCAAGADRWEGHVDRVAARLARGEAIPQTLVVLEDAGGALVGVCSFLARTLLLPPRSAPMRGIPYINMIGIDRRFRGHVLADGSRPSDALLAGALEQIGGTYGGRLPHVFALVAPENTHAHALFARHDFGEISPQKPGGEAIRMRAPG